MSIPPTTKISFFSLLALSVPSALQGADWPHWRGPNRDGHSAEVGISKSWEESPPKLLWVGEGMGEGYSSVAVVGGRAYTTGNFDGGQGVVAVDAKNGQLLWRTKLTESVPQHGSGGARSTPAVSDGLIFVTTSNGAIAGHVTFRSSVWAESGSPISSISTSVLKSGYPLSSAMSLMHWA